MSGIKKITRDDNEKMRIIHLPKKILKEIYLFLCKFRDRKIIYDYKEYLKNVGGPKRALLSYLVGPLQHSQNRRDKTIFSNLGIAQYIPRALNELGYIVDIVNYDNAKFVPESEYDLFIGHTGYNFENIDSKLPLDTCRIYFSTGIYWKVFNEKEKERFEALYQRRMVRLRYDRFISMSEEYANSHSAGIICLGNESARETYKNFRLAININNAIFPVQFNIENKDYRPLAK